MITKLIICIVCIILVLSCHRQKTEVTYTDTINTDRELLSQYIRLSILPDSVQWSIKNLGEQGKDAIGPTDKAITMILTYSVESMKKIREEVEGKEDIKDKIYLDKSFIKKWFPQSLKSIFYQEGKYYRLRTSMYTASQFAKTPFTNGFCSIAADNQILVYLHTN